MKTKICYILPNFDTATGSHFFHIYELLERAAKELDLFLVIEKAASPVNNLSFNVYVQKFSFAPLRMAELIFILMFKRLSGRRYFYTHYSYFGAIGSWIVTSVFGGVPYYWNCGMPWKYKRGFLEESVFKFILRHTSLVTGTLSLAVEYGKNYGLEAGNIKVLPNWIMVDRFIYERGKEDARSKLAIKPEAKVVLYVHRLSRRKGAHMILPIAYGVTKCVSNVIFLIVGSGPEEESIKSEIRRCKLGDMAKLVGEVPNKDIRLYFAAADAFLMPSEEEGFPHVLIEAMAAGIPYAASDVGAVREVTPSVLHEFIVPAGNINWFTDKISLLLSKSPEELKHIKNTINVWVRQYDIDTVLPKFLALFS